eukprot:2983107-Prymnesium_polylepis.1
MCIAARSRVNSEAQARAAPSSPHHNAQSSFWRDTWSTNIQTVRWPMAYDAPCGGNGRYARPA